METIRRRKTGYDNLSAEQQVSYVIEYWDEIWTPSKENPSIPESLEIMESLNTEWIDEVIIPDLLDKIEGTEVEKYKYEIISNYYSFLFI